MAQKILLNDQRKLLRDNAILSAAAILLDGNTPDHKPVVKFFNPCGAATWLISEMDNDGRMFGLCDPGHGTPELGYVMLDEITGYVGPLGLKIERDAWFEAKRTIGEYADLARAAGRIAA
jgi:hypothetical protein